MDTIDIRDLAAVRGLIQAEFGDWGPERTVTQDDIDAFARLTGDHQWIHVDVERSRRESPFGRPVAHGFLTLSLLPSLAPPMRVELEGVLSQINYGADGLRFLAPVPAGSRLHARSRITDVREHSRGTVITTETTVHVVDAERPAIVYTGKILYEHGTA